MKPNQIIWSDPQTAFFLSNQVASHHVFDFIINEMKSADSMIISSFAITDQYVRRLIRNSGRISRITLFLDFTIASRNARVTQFAASNVAELFLTNNHSKTIYAKNNDTEMLAVISNNATNNLRYESGIIFRNHPIIPQFLQQFETMQTDSVQWKS
jgi:hypothetical protein